MAYRPQVKTENGIVDLPLDAETVKGKTILEQTYPVGAIYISVDNTSPASLFGGTWAEINNTFLLSQGYAYVAGATGGSINHNHSLNPYGYAKISRSFASDSIYSVEQTLGGYYSAGRVTGVQANSYVGSLNKAVELGGDTNSASSMPPYLVVYMWKRTA